MQRMPTRNALLTLIVGLTLGACGRAPAEAASEARTEPARTVSFAYRGGGGDFVFVTTNGRPEGVELAPGASYFGTVGGRVITYKDGVLRIGDQLFPELPLEADVVLLNGEVIVNGELWGRVED